MIIKGECFSDVTICSSKYKFATSLLEIQNASDEIEWYHDANSDIKKYPNKIDQLSFLEQILSSINPKDSK